MSHYWKNWDVDFLSIMVVQLIYMASPQEAPKRVKGIYDRFGK